MLGDPTADLLDVCRRLSAEPALAGHEDRLAGLVVDHLAARGLTARVDRLGQVSVELGRADAERTILVSAHLDELGLMVRGWDGDGMLRVHRLGGMPERVLPGLRMVLHARGTEIPVVVGLQSHHLTPPEDKYVARPAAELYLDAGFGSAADVVAAGVRVGDPVTYASAWDQLAGGRFAGKSLDDRVGVAILLALVDRWVEAPPQTRLVAAFTTQEEFHVRGALALAAEYTPDIVVNIDIAPAPDTPGLRGVGQLRLGGGPALSRMNFHGRGTLGGLIPHPGLVDALETAAESAGVGVQYDATIGVITDAAFMPMATAEGVAAIGVGVPVRYTHSPIETAQLSDVTDTVELLAEAVLPLSTVSLHRPYGRRNP
jgi:putative aminopeptidase